MQIVGQKHNLELINSWETMPPFTIIQGDRNTGKTTMVLYMCEHFDLKYVKMKNGVNDVRQLIKYMTPNSNTIYHFKDFDKASIQAKNALLKITEEPIVGNYIVITGNTQIKTLESRARKLVMSAYSLEEMTSYMQKYYENYEIQKKLYMAGLNTPSKIDKYSKYEAIIPLLDFAYKMFDKITYLNEDYYIPAVMQFDIKYENVDASILFLDMLIHIIEYQFYTKPYYDYYDILNALIAAKESLEKDYTLNRRFILYRVLYTISQMMKGNQ